jgi:hypothetical protein
MLAAPASGVPNGWILLNPRLTLSARAAGVSVDVSSASEVRAVVALGSWHNWRLDLTGPRGLTDTIRNSRPNSPTRGAIGSSRVAQCQFSS